MWRQPPSPRFRLFGNHRRLTAPQLDRIRASTTASAPGPLLDTQKFEDGFHGYRFEILKAQGANARGAARVYALTGRMTRGFALLAWPCPLRR